MANFGEIIRRAPDAELIDLRSGQLTRGHEPIEASGFDARRIKRPGVVLAEAIVDTSTSMKDFTSSEGTRCDGQATVIRCYNGMLKDMQQRDNPRVQVVFSARGFNGMLQDYAFPQDCAPLTTSRYKPDGGTPLLDTLGDSFTEADYKEQQIRARNIRCRKAFMILSDGLEESSSRFSFEEIEQKIEQVYQNSGNFILGIGLGPSGCDQLRELGIRLVCDATKNIRLDAIFREFTTMTTQGTNNSVILEQFNEIKRAV